MSYCGCQNPTKQSQFFFLPVILRNTKHLILHNLNQILLTPYQVFHKPGQTCKKYIQILQNAFKAHRNYITFLTLNTFLSVDNCQVMVSSFKELNMHFIWKIPHLAKHINTSSFRISQFLLNPLVHVYTFSYTRAMYHNM